MGVAVLIFNNKNQILLGKRMVTHGKFTWAPPGGHLEFGESLEACAIREVFEETGLLIQRPVFMALTNDIFEMENQHYISIIMKTLINQEHMVQNCEPHKTEGWKWFDLESLPSPLFSSIHQLISNKFYGTGLNQKAS